MESSRVGCPFRVYTSLVDCVLFAIGGNHTTDKPLRAAARQISSLHHDPRHGVHLCHRSRAQCTLSLIVDAQNGAMGSTGVHQLLAPSATHASAAVRRRHVDHVSGRRHSSALRSTIHCRRVGFCRLDERWSARRTTSVQAVSVCKLHVYKRPLWPPVSPYPTAATAATSATPASRCVRRNCSSTDSARHPFSQTYFSQFGLHRCSKASIQ